MTDKVNPSPNISASLIQADVFSLKNAISDLIRNLFNELANHARRINATLPKDGSEPLEGVVVLASYAKTALPPVSTAGLIYVTNDTGGAVPAFSDGVNWRRVTDRAVIA